MKEKKVRHHHHDHDGHGHHNHTHHHGHHGAVENIKWAFFLNLGFTILEIFGGFFTNSIAILSDALHDFGDTLSLGVAWYLEKIAQKDSDRIYSYGYARFSVLGAFINSIVLVVGCLFILQETIPRIIHPEVSDAKGMIIFAIIGIAINGLAAWRLQRGHTLNEKVVSLHLIEDVLGWAAILIGSIVMLFVELPILDPILSVLIMSWVLFNVFRNLGKSFRIFLQAAPDRSDTDEILEKIKGLDDVVGAHDFHLWTLDGEYNIATVHVVVKNEKLSDAEKVKSQVRKLFTSFKVEHVTIEIESEDYFCGVNCDDETKD